MINSSGCPLGFALGTSLGTYQLFFVFHIRILYTHPAMSDYGSLPVRNLVRQEKNNVFFPANSGVENIYLSRYLKEIIDFISFILPHIVRERKDFCYGNKEKRIPLFRKELRKEYIFFGWYLGLCCTLPSVPSSKIVTSSSYSSCEELRDLDDPPYSSCGGLKAKS